MLAQIRENVLIKSSQFFTPRCHWHRGCCLHGVIDTWERDSRRVNDNAEFFCTHECPREIETIQYFTFENICIDPFCSCLVYTNQFKQIFPISLTCIVLIWRKKFKNKMTFLISFPFWKQTIKSICNDFWVRIFIVFVVMCKHCKNILIIED